MSGGGRAAAADGGGRRPAGGRLRRRAGASVGRLAVAGGMGRGEGMTFSHCYIWV